MATSPYSSAKVLVTGGAGFIGSNLANRLVELGAKVTIIDSFLDGGGANEANLGRLRGKVSLIKADLALTSSTRHITGFDFVFNLAAQTGHKESLLDPFTDLHSNVSASLNILEAVRKSCPHAVVVYAGTRDQYGHIKKNPVDENHPLTPLDPNGVSKQAAEDYHFLYYRIHGIRTVSLRLTNIYGPHLQIRTPKQGFIGWFINLALTGQTITVFGDGTQLRDILYVDDAVDAILRAGVTEKAYGEAFNIASGKGTPLIDIAQAIVRHAAGGSIRHAEFPPNNKKIEIGDFVGNIAKARRILGWRPRVTLNDGIRRTISFYKGRMRQYGAAPAATTGAARRGTGRDAGRRRQKRRGERQ